MGRVVEQERADRESQEEAHKNEVRMVEELLNGRQAPLFFLFHAGILSRGSKYAAVNTDGVEAVRALFVGHNQRAAQ